MHLVFRVRLVCESFSRRYDDEDSPFQSEDGSVLSLAASPEVLHERLHAASKISQIESFVEGLPAGYDTLLDEKGLSLSGESPDNR